MKKRSVTKRGRKKSRGKKRLDGLPRGDRPSLETQLKRFNVIEELYVRFMSPAKVIAFATLPVEKKGLGISERRVREYIKKIRALWEKEAPEERQHRREQHRRSLLARIAKAEQAGKWSAVFQGHKLLAEIDGVMAPVRGELYISGELSLPQYLQGMNPDQLEEFAETGELPARGTNGSGKTIQDDGGNGPA